MSVLAMPATVAAGLTGSIELLPLNPDGAARRAFGEQGASLTMRVAECRIGLISGAGAVRSAVGKAD